MALISINEKSFFNQMLATTSYSISFLMEDFSIPNTAMVPDVQGGTHLIYPLVLSMTLYFSNSNKNSIFSQKMVKHTTRLDSLFAGLSLTNITACKKVHITGLYIKCNINFITIIFSAGTYLQNIIKLPILLCTFSTDV